jgi:hypothetical protein
MIVTSLWQFEAKTNVGNGLDKKSINLIDFIDILRRYVLENGVGRWNVTGINEMKKW